MAHSVNNWVAKCVTPPELAILTKKYNKAIAQAKCIILINSGHRQSGHIVESVSTKFTSTMSLSSDLSVWWHYYVLTKSTCHELCSAVSGTCVCSHPFPLAVSCPFAFSLDFSCIAACWHGSGGFEPGNWFFVRESITVIQQTLFWLSARNCGAGFAFVGLTVGKVLHNSLDTSLWMHTIAVQQILFEDECEVLIILSATCSCQLKV